MSDKKYSVFPDRPPKVVYCSKCVMPSLAAAAVSFDSEGVCTGCRVAAQREEVDWTARKNKFSRLVERYRSKDGANYDCIIPVSGGKDSYFQTHIIKNVMGLNPLLITYHGNNYTKTGLENLRNMQAVFGVDHLFFTPSINVLKSLNRLGMLMMGDMNWHAHSGIFTLPIRLFEWYDFLEAAPRYGETLEKKDLITWMYPSDEEIDQVGVRGIYISNYFRWDANEHGPMVMKQYGFKEAEEPFERTYRRMSNLDDMHENGIHDYMKYIKFGYGRATDHCCKDIRAGIMTRDQAIEIVRQRDPIKPKDLYRWLEYVGWTEEKFDSIADSYRDPRVWRKGEHGEWVKDNIWD